MRFIGEPEDVDRLLWCLPSAPSPVPVDDGPSFEFEFSDQTLPDVYKLLASDGGADGRKTAGVVDDDDWVLFADVSTALSVNTVEALAKLLDDENAVMAVPADRFKERAVLRKSLGRQPIVVPATPAAAYKSIERPSKDDNDSVATKEAPCCASSSAPSTTTTSAGAAAATITTTTATAVTTSAATPFSPSTSCDEQILLVRYDHKLKQLLGVNVYTVS